jgi:hypothetical protein
MDAIAPVVRRGRPSVTVREHESNESIDVARRRATHLRL